LEEFVEPFLDAGDAYEWAWPLAELAVRVDDTHCWVGNAYQYMNLGFYYVPAETVYVEGKTVVSRVWPELMQPPGVVQIGDVILETKGQDIDTFRASMMKYAEGSNEPTKNRQVNDYVVRHTTTTLPFKIERDGQILDVVAEGINYYYIYWKKKYEDAAQEMWKILPGNIGYVNMKILKKEDVPVVMPQLMNTQAIIFDVRQRPNGTHYLLADWLNRVPKKFSKFKVPERNVPGYYYMSEYVKVGQNNPDYYRGKVILLVNEQTQSHGEFVCMALQTAPDVTVVGSTTAGADGDYVFVYLPGGNSFTFSGLGVFYPNGHPTQQIGIVPDLYVRPTVEGIRQGRDEVLERAIEFVESSE
jgi:C-terminal processing protease CtpA/Prc